MKKVSSRMLRQSISRPVLLLALATSAVSCRVQPATSPEPSVDGRAPASASLATSPGGAAPASEPILGPGDSKERAVVFQLALGATVDICSPPILHGLDASGTKIWSKAFQGEELSCTKSEVAELTSVRIEHPYLALRRGLYFSGPPSGTVRIDHEFFGDCLVELTGLDQSDSESQLIVCQFDREGYGEAAFNGRSEVLGDLSDLKFERLPIGRYELGLFRADEFPSGRPYQVKTLSVRPCKETIVTLAGAAQPRIVPGRTR